jgi:Tfp pilus assembly protein PilN
VAVSRGRISSAKAIALPPAGAPTGRLALQPHFGAAPVHVAISDRDNVHRLLLVPPMTAAERSEVVSRESEREGGVPRATAWGNVRRIEVDGLPMDELLVAMVSPDRLEQALEPILEDGAVPRTVVTGSVALLAAARSLAPAPLDRPTALVHWGTATLTIAVVSEGVLKFARVIEPPAATLDPFDWIPVEVDRSVRHYSSASKGERVEQVMVSVADADAARRVFADGDLAERLRLTVTNLNALLAPAVSQPLDPNVAAGTFTLAYGAALLGANEAPNLLPPALAFGRRSRKVIAAAVAASATAVALVASSLPSMAQRADGLRARLSQLQSAQQAAQVRLDEGSRAEAEREQARQLARFLGDDPLNLIPPIDPLREIARLAPADLRLEQLTLSADAQGYAVNLVGRVELDDFTEAQRTLNEFYYGLRDSPIFYAVTIQQSSWAPQSVVAAADPSETSAEPDAQAAADLAATSVVGAERPLEFVFVLRLKRLA